MIDCYGLDDEDEEGEKEREEERRKEKVKMSRSKTSLREGEVQVAWRKEERMAIDASFLCVVLAC